MNQLPQNTVVMIADTAFFFFVFCLFHPQTPNTLLLRNPPLLMTLLKRRRYIMRSPKVIQILDLVNPNDPIVAGERFVQGGELGSFDGETRTSDTIDALSFTEEFVVLVVGHFVPKFVNMTEGKREKGQKHT